MNLENINPDKFDEKFYDVNKDQYFIIKSYSYDDVINSIKHKIWCSTENGNIRLNSAYRKSLESNGKVFLLFSVNGSGCFCGIAQMTSHIDFDWIPNGQFVWSNNNKWKGKFNVEWLYIKDVPNRQLSYITLENNDNKPITHSRDCQLIPSTTGIYVFKIIHYYHHYSTILDNL